MLDGRYDMKVTVAPAGQLAGVGLDEALEFLADCPPGSYLQRPDWPRLCPPPARHSYVVLCARAGGELAGLALARLTRLGPGRRLATLRRGPVTRGIDDLLQVVPAMVRALRELGVCSLVLNPRWCDAEAERVVSLLEGLGARVLPATEQSLHRATLVVDLPGAGAPASALDAGLKQRGRRQIRKAEAMGLSVRPAASLDEAMLYAPILADFHARRGLSLENIPDVETQWQLTRSRGAFLLGWYDGRVICGHTVIADGPRAFWLTMASLDADPDLPKNYLLLHAALKAAQAQGFAQYDMAGTPSHLLTGQADAAAENRDQFKTAFGPRHVELVPAMVLAVRPAEHALLFNLRRTLRVIAGRSK